MSFYISDKTLAALRAAGCKENYLRAMANIAESLMLMGDPLSEIVNKWRGYRPEWWQ
jgi:hypothetical protein